MTIYTDRYGLYPWVMLAGASFNFWSAYGGFQNADGSKFGLGIGVGVLFLILAIKRFWDIRQAHREGCDVTIVRVKNAKNQ